MANCEDITTQLGRIATALESIESKTIERYTYEEFIEDIEDAFGIGSILANIVDSVFGLMPNLKAKVDFTPFILSLVETRTRWRPIHDALNVMAKSSETITATMVTGKTLGIINTIFETLDVIGDGWQDLILGDKNIYDGLVKPIWNLFIPDNEGGTGGDDPDNDPTLRIETLLMADGVTDAIEAMTTMLETRSVAETTAQNTNFNDLISQLAACCPVDELLQIEQAIRDIRCGTGGGSTVIVEPDPAEEEDPNLPADYQCQAANRIIDDLITAMSGLEVYHNWFISYQGANKAPYPNLFDIYDLISRFLPNLLPNSIEYNLTPAGLAAINTEMADRYHNYQGLEVSQDWVPANPTFKASMFDVYKHMRNYFNANKEDIVCEIYEAASATALKTALIDRLTLAKNYALGQAAYLIDTAEALATMTGMLSNGFLNIRFSESSYATGYTGTVDCEGCGEPWFTIPSDQELLNGSLNENTTEFTLLASENAQSPGNFYSFVTNVSGQCLKLTVVELTNYTPTANISGNVVYWRNCAGQVVGQPTGSPMGHGYCVGNTHYLGIGGSGSPGVKFTIRYTVSTETTDCYVP